MPQPIPLPPPGWHPDPEGSGRDRWWTGSAWSDTYAKAPPQGWLYPPSYYRSMRPGLNRDAFIARLTLPAAGLLMLVGFVTLMVLSATRAAAPNLVAGALTCVGIAAVGSIVAIVAGIRGIRAAARLGGFGVSVWAIVSGSIVFIWCLSILGYAFIPLALVR
ncbi:DUF2510 domain-containing protein [Cnuibacter sp. UC19_7]|uniref:DUF2510 domain-containing protein n=1 Tax=Cnuibacter sp. UC19_7 TaxID=3350166 RepID=UPI00366BEE6F